MIFGDYFNAMDRSYGSIEPQDVKSDAQVGVDTTSLGPQELGTSTNPMMHQVQAFAAKIREGASKIEVSFMGAGKSNSQQPSPEAFGAKDRADIRSMAEINDIKTSVHAALHGESLAGLGREGFSGEGRQHALKEIERAINFASEATKGGAIVFHTGEWIRPMSEIEDKAGAKFLSHADEAQQAPVIVVDDQTGAIQHIRKDHYVFEPKFLTAADVEKEQGKKVIGTTDANGNQIEADDWIDMKGNAIKREWLVSTDNDKIERMFDRIPRWNEGKTNFDVEKRDFSHFEEEAKKLSQKLGQEVAPEILFFKSQLANQVLQYKGNALFHGQHYSEYKKMRDKTREALNFYEGLEKDMPEDQKWKLMKQMNYGDFIPPENMLPSDYLKEKLLGYENQMRYIHESSAESDARAKEALERMNRLKTVEEYGIHKTAETIGKAGLMARQYSDSHRKELNESIFVAPENWRPEQFGSHPDEIRKIVNESRKYMQNQLVREGLSEKDAAAKAKEHIKATVDIGHFNLWRQHFQAKEGESPEARHKRFEKWMLDETEKLAKEGIIGHIHLTDNFGYDDEHLTPGQGNVPMKEFIKRMEKAGIRDIISEAGSFNGTTVMHDTWALVGSPVYGVGRLPTFRGMREQHLGYHSPAPYIVGAYSPSNEWKLWSETPME